MYEQELQILVEVAVNLSFLYLYTRKSGCINKSGDTKGILLVLLKFLLAAATNHIENIY